MNFLDVNTTSNKRKKKMIISILGGASTLLGVFAAVVVNAGFPNLLPNTFDQIAGTAREVVEKTLPMGLYRSPDAHAEGGVIVQPVPEFPEFVGEPLSPESFSAASIIVRDNRSGMILFAKDPYAQRPIASITKLMSALVVLERQLEWTATTTVAADIGFDSSMYAGDTYTLLELWNAALVGSSNKAIVTLADATGMTREEFVSRMNQKAFELGMNETVFVEPSGLSAGNVSTASDITILLDEAMQHTEIREASLLREQELYSLERKKEHHMWSTNWLMLGWIPHSFTTIIGGKTGYIPDSLYNFTVQLVDARGHILDVVVLGAEEYNARFTEARDAAMWAYESYAWPGDETIPVSTEVEIVTE